jgi:hypothetical protein
MIDDSHLGFDIPNDRNNVFVSITDIKPGINYYLEYPGNGFFFPPGKLLDADEKLILGTSGLSGCCAVCIDIFKEDENKHLFWMSHIMSDITQENVNTIMDNIISVLNQNFDTPINWSDFNERNFNINLCAVGKLGKIRNTSDKIMKYLTDLELLADNIEFIKTGQIYMEIKNKRIGYVPPALRDIVRPKIDYSLLYKRPKDWNYGST